MREIILAGLLLSGLPALAQVPSAAESTLPSPTASVSVLDTENGFRTYRLGTPVKEYPELKRISNDLYESPKEALLVGEVPLTSLRFTSYKERLASIVFGTRGTDKIEQLLATFTRAYGPSTTTSAMLQKWVGKSVTLYVTRVGAGDQEVGIVIMKSNELAAAQKAGEN